ncbi:MAG: fumarylacetoacetase [Candidatus Eremiobacteraeota bacterium]|nr:fumarylacetoacetase [Candidatus Eremiobacteraeota bacterium]MBV9645994.1 fumarylacetoacetase [Candidatus Eremiobacteraeota bacterium]
MNETHDPKLRSWVTSAAPGHDFPIQNLPFGIFRRRASGERFRGGVAIGDEILDLGAAWHRGVFPSDVQDIVECCCAPGLNDFMALGPQAWSALRLALSRTLRAGAREEAELRRCLVLQRNAEMALPARCGDYTDFYASVYHATNVGKLFRPDNPLLPNYAWVPIAYHGRSSSLCPSGYAFRRPIGQTMPPEAASPVVQPTRRLDFELEVAVWIGVGNDIGSRVSLEDAERHIFGLGLLNDWSARDVQAWEYQPLGPFLAKSFATTVSPWIVTLEALEPFRVPWEGPNEGAKPLPYLDAPSLRERAAFDVQLEARLQTETMRAKKSEPVRLARTSFRHTYWTVAQMVAHHTMNGCNLRPGDLFGTGTQSGPTSGELGSLLELTEGGKQPFSLGDGETRTFLEDGDTVVLHAWCEKEGSARIGFGTCEGSVLAAIS